MSLIVERPTPTFSIAWQYLQRCVLPPGETRLLLAGRLHDSGLPDVRDATAIPLPVQDLPAEVTTYLNGRSYCETDKLGSSAWNAFGHPTPGVEMVQAICNFTHDRMTFDYKQARPTRTALEAHEERVAVCRDFTHLAITLCRCMNIPAR